MVVPARSRIFTILYLKSRNGSGSSRGKRPRRVVSFSDFDRDREGAAPGEPARSHWITVGWAGASPWAALWELGGVPQLHRTSWLSAAVHDHCDKGNGEGQA